MGSGGLYAVLAPLNQAAGKTGFEIVRLVASGREQARRGHHYRHVDVELHGTDTGAG